MRYQLTPQAQEDLKKIRRFTLQQWGATQAQSYLLELRSTLQTLARMPGMGRSRVDDLGESIYSFPYASHMIYYRQLPEVIVVVAVLHGSMVPAAHLDERL